MLASVIRVCCAQAKHRPHWPTLVLLLAGFSLVTVTEPAWGAVQENKPSATPAAQQNAQRPKKIANPKRDPADQSFRLAPMVESSRTIAIPLATNLHLAFDTELLRTHTAWVGPSLALFGPPYNGVKTPFLATAEGTILWTMPAIGPWSASPPSANQPTQRGSARFRGLSNKAGAVTLMYELSLATGKAVSIYEQARACGGSDHPHVLRRFEVGPSPEDLWFVAHAELGAIAKLARGEATVLVQRTNDVLLALAKSSGAVEWSVGQGPASFEETLNADEKGESVIRKRTITGTQARAILKIPAHTSPVAVEILSAVLKNSSEAESFGAEFLDGSRPAPSDLAFLTSNERLSKTPLAKVFPGDKNATLRASGDEHFQIEHFPLPKEINLQVTGMDWLSKDELAVATWSGEIYVVEHAPGPVEAATYRRFARGLNEPLGLKVHDRRLYAVQKPELTRITDTDGNGEADRFESINADWGYTGNYHAFAFGPLVDTRNNFYAFLCGQHGRWDVPYVGWCVRISPDGKKLDGFCSGLRAPNGVGFYGLDNDLFMADNQGNWIGACKLNHLQRGRFYGFPSGTPAPESEYKNPKLFAPPAIWFPRRWSPSTSGFVTIEDDRFGPFQGQMLVGDFQNAVVLRVFLEKVKGEWQGAVWPFAKGFLSGVNRLSMGPDGKLYVGGLKNAAWAAIAPREYSLERVRFTGKMPFEIKEVHATNFGLDLMFTQGVDVATASNVDNYDVRQFTYLYHSIYGSPEIDHDGNKDSSTPITVKKAEVSEDRSKVRLTLEGWKTGYVTWVRCLDIQNAEAQPLWHDSFYYTLNQVPEN